MESNSMKIKFTCVGTVGNKDIYTYKKQRTDVEIIQINQNISCCFCISLVENNLDVICGILRSINW